MALDNFRKTSMRIDKANQRFLDYQNAKAGDINGRELLVQITNNGVVEDQTGTTLKLNWQHENGNQGSTDFNVVDIKTGKYSLYYPTEMLYKGTVDASVEINSNGQTTNTMNFKIVVHADVFNGEAGTVDGVFISLADVNKKLDDREKEYVELKERQTSVETQFDAVQQELTGKDVVSAPEIIAARNGEPTLSARLDKEQQEVTAQLAQTVSGELGKKPVALAGVIRNTGSGWFYIDDIGHNRINMSTVTVQNGSIRVEHTGTAKKVGALVATPDETFGKEGMIVGASVGNTFSLIDLFLPLNVQIKGDGTFVAKSYFTPSLSLTFSADKSSFTLVHPETDALDMPMLVSPISVGSSGEFAVSYSGTSVTVERRGDLAGYIYYDVASASWKYQGDNVNDLSFTFGGGVLTVTHSAVVGNLYGLVVSERDGGYKPIVVSPLTASFQIKLKDTSGNTISTPDANCKFYFARIGAKYKMPFKSTERVVLKRGHTKVDANNVSNASGNIWIQGLMQN